MRRVVITGGGTGGHLYPALAVAEVLQKDAEVEELLYIGNIGRKEAELIPRYGIRFEGLRFSGMPRKIGLGLISWTWELVAAFFHSRHLLKYFAPDVVFATGGYVTAPVLLAARSLNVPYVLHEPDAYPGMVNRIMAPWAAQVTCAFADARQHLRSRHLHVTGNPLRGRIGQISRESALANLNLSFSLERPILLVTGGSQGARRINQGVIEALPGLIEKLGIQIIHQTGEKLFEEALSLCPKAYRNHAAYSPLPFIEDMASALVLADLAVCRSGSMTLSEMYQSHIPTILVPYPFAAADHQRQNALASQKSGASIIVEDDAFTGEELFALLSNLLSDPGKLQAMRKSTEALSTPHATSDVVQVIKSSV